MEKTMNKTVKNRGPWRAAARGVTESETTERLNSNKCRATLLGGPAQSNLQMPAVPVDID